ncbi:glycosyltransferase family 9 protein [Desulfobaculum senezii]
MAKALPTSWLVVRMSALGDVVLTTGVLDHLHATRGWTFHVLTKKPNAPVLTGHPAIENTVMPEDASLKGLKWVQAARELAARYDGWGLLDLHGTLRSMVLATFWRGPVRRYPKFSLARRLFGRFGWQWAGDSLTTLNVPQRYARAVERGAVPASAVRPIIHLSEAERAEARGILSRHSLAAPIAALHPYATHDGKKWPDASWRELTERLVAAGWRCLIVGHDPTPLYGASAPDGVTDLTSATTLRQTCALLEQCDVLVTGDSGPMHLGTAVRTRTVGLFGPTTRHWGFFPSGEHDTVLESALPCRPCSLHGGRGCDRGVQCMRDITPDAVFHAVTAPQP